MVTGKTPKSQRKKIIEEFKAGQIKCLINIDVLTTGFNCRDLDMIVMLRPTGSPPLYVQMVGRECEPLPGRKTVSCWIFLQMSRDTGRSMRLTRKLPEKARAYLLQRKCPDCQAIIAAGFRICPVCGHEFPPPEPKIAPKPVEAPVLKSQIKPQEYTVTRVWYCRHKKQGKRDSVRIEYTCGFLNFKEWVFPEASSPQQQFFYGKFMSAVGIAYEDWPRSVDAFLESLPALLQRYG